MTPGELLVIEIGQVGTRMPGSNARQTEVCRTLLILLGEAITRLRRDSRTDDAALEGTLSDKPMSDKPMSDKLQFVAGRLTSTYDKLKFVGHF